jgi:cobalt/nickel transport system ATP-binding protein
MDGISDALIELRGVHFRYPAHPPTLKGADLRLLPGERVGLVGGNGCGKSTLLHLIVGLHKVDAGEVFAFGAPRRAETDFREVRRRAGLVFQHADDQLFCPTVLDDVAFGPLNLGKAPGEAREIAMRSLERVGLADFAERITYKLSGGEKRGVAIATVLAMEPDVLLLDEPTTGLDAAAVARLCEVLRSLPQAMILVSHDHGLVHDLSSRCVQLADGTIQALD